MISSWENDSSYDSLFDMFDPKYKSDKNITRPFSKTPNKIAKTSSENGQDSEPSLLETSFLEQGGAKPNLKLIASEIKGIGANYSNEEAENAYGRNGYMVEYNNLPSNTSLLNNVNSTASSIDVNQCVDLTVKNTLTSSETTVNDKIVIKPALPDKREKKKYIFKSMSQSKVRSLAMITLLENQKTNSEKIVDNKILNQKPNKSNNTVNPALNIIDTIDLTDTDVDRTFSEKTDSGNACSNPYTIIPEINSKQKVMCWLNSNSKDSHNYMNQLSASEPSGPKEYVPDANIERAYQEIMKKKAEDNVSEENTDQAKGTIWDVIKSKINS